MNRFKSYIILGIILLSGAVLPTRADIYQDTQTIGRLLLALDALYVDTVNTQQLTEVAVKAMLKELDPHSTYLTAEEAKAMNESLGGNFEGIGVTYQMENDTLLIINTIQGGPSEKAGIMASDRIIMVGDSTIAGMKYSTREIQRRLRGPKGTHVNIGVMRAGEKDLIWFDIERDKIPINSLDATYMAAPKVGYVKVSRFAQTTGEELAKAIQQLSKEGMQDLIIDLQGNGGGLVSAAVEMAELFLPSGEMVVYTEGRSEKRRNYRTQYSSHTFKGRVVVLMDEVSASAAEIFAGCMQDLDRGVILGRRSFGKGLVQRPVILPNGGLVRLTIAHYYTPSGRCIQKPYTKGDMKGYDEDFKNRLNAGELFSSDSIHFNDSLRFLTKGGRTVYGGGGIMPDLFVPMDTTQTTKAHRAVVAKGTLNRFTLNYFRTHQARLKKLYPTIKDYLNNGFEISDEMVSELIAQARKDSVKNDSLETLLTNDVFRLQMKASLANDLYGTSAYSQIMNQIIPSFREAVALITDEKRYRQLLSPQ